MSIVQNVFLGQNPLPTKEKKLDSANGPTFAKKQVTADKEAIITLEQVKIEIPANAVKDTVEISIEKLQSVNALNPGMDNTTAGASGYRFTPDGMKFLQPIKVTIPYDVDSVPEDGLSHLYTYFYDTEQRCWERLERVGIDTVHGTVTSLTTHFTDMINGVLALPETAKPLTFNPNSIKEIKAADPGAGIHLIEPPKANSQGNTSLSYPLELPPGRNGLQPQLVVTYNSDGRNGWMGLGWDIPFSTIAVDTRWGVPRFDVDYESETYLLDGMQLTPMAHRGVWEARTGDKEFHTRIEGDFRKIIRYGYRPSRYEKWEVIDKQGTLYTYGDDSILADEQGNLFKWPLTEVMDSNRNTINYEWEFQNDSGVGDGNGNDGIQLYPKTIIYNDITYAVNFIRDRELGEGRRSDVDIDGRYGTKLVTADLLRKIEIRYKTSYEDEGELIRCYAFEYQEGAFQKTLLKAIIQYGQDGTEFNRHEFSYYDEVTDGEGLNGFAAPVVWNTGNDDMAVDLPGPNGKTSVLGSSKGSSHGKHLYVGIGLSAAKSKSIGFKTGSSQTESEDLVAFIDLNGDGLPDKVFKRDGTVWFRPNNGPAEAPVFGEPVALNINTFGKESSSTTSRGGEGYSGLSSSMSNIAQSITTANVYFSDVNGDGLPDLVTNGRVYFSRLVDGKPTFVLDDSAGTPVPISGASLDTNQLVGDFEEEYNALLDASPLMDALRVWRAPFTGKIAISAPVRLSQIEREDYATADGVRVAIQHNSSEVWRVTIGANDYGTYTPSGVSGLNVQKGDRLYFRVSSIFDGAFDQVEWDPEITYLNVAADLADANNLTPNHYRASQDFTYAGRSGSVQVPISGTVRITGDLQKTGQTSDHIQLVVYQNDNVAISRSLDWDAIDTITMGDELTVLEGDTLAFHIETDSPIDLKQLYWNPKVYYTSAVDASIELTDAEGNPNVMMPIFCDYDVYHPVSPAAAQGCWVATQTGTLTVVPKVTVAGASGIDGDIFFTLKKPVELVAKQRITVTNGQAQTPSTLTIDVVQGDKLYFDFSSRQQNLNGKVTVSAQVYYTPVSIVTVPSTFHCAVAISPNALPEMYRGWGYVAYNGNRNRYAQPINENDLVINDTYGSAALPNVFVMVPDLERQCWASQDDECWIAAEHISSSRYRDKYISRYEAIATAEVRAVNRIGKARQSTSSSEAGMLSISDSSGSSWGALDFLDMNGDGFPDIVGSSIQYTTPTGGLEEQVRDSFGRIRESANHARIGGIGGNPLAPKNDDRGRPGTNTKIDPPRTMPSLGITYNFVDEEGTQGNRELVDINGDGLPDKVWLEDGNIMVALNLGYGFAAPEQWGNGAILETTSENQPINVGPGISKGFNSGEYSFAGGVNYNNSRSQVLRQLIDINGDGLPDMVIKNGGAMYVAFNTGNRFAAPIEWRGAPDRFIGENQNTQRGAGAYFTYSIKIPMTPLFIIINPGADVGASMGRRETALMDVNGDGCPDFVIARENGQIEVAMNRVGVTNKLQSVSRPLGASFTIHYHREGNTYDMPHKRWVLDKTVLYDGQDNDGADHQVTTYRYSGGKYDRLEREFNGFRQVIAEYWDTQENRIIKTITTKYLVDSYYTKGLVESIDVHDAEGNPFIQTQHQYRLFDVFTETDLVNTYPGNTVATVFPQLVRTQTQFYEGHPVPGVQTYQTFAYDKYGNVTHYFDAGNPGANDDVEAHITYLEKVEQDPYWGNYTYIVGKPNSTQVYSNGELLRHREADYDDYGNLIELRQYLADGRVSVTNFTYYTGSDALLLMATPAYADGNNYYGTGGTLRSVTGPANANGERYTVWFNYDPIANTHVTEMTDSFGYVSSAEYNYYYGVQTAATDINGNIMRREYDQFGRLTKIFAPYDDFIPAVSFAYYPHEVVPRAVTKNKLHFDPLNEETIDTVLFTDGLKRVIQTKKEAEVLLPNTAVPTYGMTVSGKVVFDALGRIIQQGQPIFEAGMNTGFSAIELKNPTVTQYDILDRPIRVTMPDSSTLQTAFSIENGDFKTVVTDAEGKEKHTYKDIRSNITKVVQFNNGETITTTYNYDPLSQITRVTDTAGHHTDMLYDLLGRRTQITNPDRGQVDYSYDLAGNLIRKLDDNLRAKGVAIHYGYTYNRLEKIHYPESPDILYIYGHPGAEANRGGRICQIIDATGTTDFYFGKLGEVERTIKTMHFGMPGHEAWMFETEAGYNYLGQVQWMTYPDGEKLTYTYDKGGAITGAFATKFIDRYDFIKQIAYDEFGQRVYIKYGNDVETTYAYDPARRWLDSIHTQNSLGEVFQDTQYTLDKIGNILGIANSAANVIQTYQYDDLYQLTRAEGTSAISSYLQIFDYDAIGNMVRKTSSKTPGMELNYDFTFLYQGSKPHAPNQIGNWLYQYDANGNTVQKAQGTDITEYIWDEENRLLRAKINGVSTDFRYDAAGNRMVKCGPHGETLYVSEFYQIQNRDIVTKHIFVGTTRVAAQLSRYKEANLYDTGYQRSNIYTYHPDHIGSSNFITDVAGNKFEHVEYAPYGETWIDEGANLNVIGYRFTGKELDTETGLYYFGARYLDPQNARWLSPDPALPQYMPELPLNDEIRQRNARLPGMGGMFNPVNMQLYHYAANNPMKYVDPIGNFSIVARSQWGANSVIENRLEGNDYIIDPYNYYDTIAIHHTTRSGNENIQNLQQYFQHKRGYADIAYHFVIGADGTIYEGRPINIQGAHVEGGNKGSIGIVLMGNFHNGTLVENLLGQIKGAPHSTPSSEQIASLKSLIDYLDKQYGINYVGGHKDYAKIDAHSDCPGNIAYKTLSSWGIFTKEKGNVPERPLINDFSDYIGCP